MRPVAVQFRISDRELLDRATGLQRGHQPARPFPPSGPGFRRLAGIPVFRENPRIFASLANLAWRCLRRRRVGIFFPTKLSEPLFEFALFGGQPNREGLADLLVKLPHLIDRHRLKIEFFSHSLVLTLAIRNNIIWMSRVSFPALNIGFVRGASGKQWEKSLKTRPKCLKLKDFCKLH